MGSLRPWPHCLSPPSPLMSPGLTLPLTPPRPDPRHSAVMSRSSALLSCAQRLSFSFLFPSHSDHASFSNFTDISRPRLSRSLPVYHDPSLQPPACDYPQFRDLGALFIPALLCRPPESKPQLRAMPWSCHITPAPVRLVHHQSMFPVFLSPFPALPPRLASLHLTFQSK